MMMRLKGEPMDTIKKHALPVAVGVALMLAFALGYAQREKESKAMQTEYEQLLEQRDADLQAQNELLRNEKSKCKTPATRSLVNYSGGICSCDCSAAGGLASDHWRMFLR
jgi:hypothetical protein